MPSASAAIEARVAAILSGSTSELSAVLAQLNPKAGAAPLHAAFWQRLRAHARLHDRFAALLDPLQHALAAVEPALWVGVAQHPLWSVLENLREAGTGYQPELGRAGERVLAEWSAVLEPLPAGHWDLAAARARELAAQERQKLARLEQRLIDGERGQLRSRRAQLLAAREMNRAMAGHRFSAALAAFLQNDWYRELQFCLLQHGEDSPAWAAHLALTQRLIASLQPADGDPEAQQRLYALIPDTGAELRALLQQRVHDAAELDRMLALIEGEHIVLLRGGAPAATPFALLASDDPWASSSMSLSRDLLQRAAGIPLGSAFLVRDADGERRVKLVLRLDEGGQLLFVNRLGVKALQKSFEEFGYWLATGMAQPLPAPGDAPDVLRAVLGEWLAQAEQQTQALAAQRAQQQAEALRRQAARDKALAEAEALAEARRRAAREAEQQAREAEQQARAAELQRRRTLADAEYRGDEQQRLRQARQLAVGLTIGSWVEFYNLPRPAGADQHRAPEPGAATGQAERLRLAVKLSGSGKLIFVDRDGVRRAESERDEFAARLLDGSARILDRGPQFEDTLVRVVDSLRRDRAGRE